MRALSERDAAALLAVTAELDAMDDVEPFPSRFVGTLAHLLRCSEASYCELDRIRLRGLGNWWWEDGVEGRSEPSSDPGHPYWRLRHSHPVCAYRERTNEWTTALMISDFATQREFHKTAIWDERYRHVPVTDWIDVGLRATGAHTRVFLFMRHAGGFDERDRLVLELLQPHLQRRYDSVCAAAEAADALAGAAERVEDDPRHIVLCSHNGTIEFASPQSRRLLLHYFACENGHVPAGVLARSCVSVERDGKRLTVHVAPAGELQILLLGEEDLSMDRLTPRQRTILEHVARGETDAQIALALGIAPATVNKHLEQIYDRLGVHTRTAAAALCRS